MYDVDEVELSEYYLANDFNNFFVYFASETLNGEACSYIKSTNSTLSSWI